MSPSRHYPRQPSYRPGRTYLTVQEVAWELRISKMTIYRRIHEGSLPAVRVGRSYRVTEQDLDHYIRGAQIGEWGPEE